MAAGCTAALIGLGLLALHGREGARLHGSDQRQADEDRFQGFASRPFSSSGSSSAAPVPESPEASAREVEVTMGRWRTAIAVKDAPTVVALDMVFRQAPDRFTAALEKSAKTDANERVRAFSTRVLGKLKSPPLAPVFQALLGDQSPYVRQNAAWALGELGAAAGPAVAELQRASARDPVTEVRAAARAALGKM